MEFLVILRNDGKILKEEKVQAPGYVEAYEKVRDHSEQVFDDFSIYRDDEYDEMKPNIKRKVKSKRRKREKEKTISQFVNNVAIEEEVTDENIEERKIKGGLSNGNEIYS